MHKKNKNFYKCCIPVMIGMMFLFVCSCNNAKFKKVDPIENLKWMNFVPDYPSIQTGVSYDVKVITPTEDGGFIMAAYVYFEKTLFDALLMKVALSGNIEWTKTYGGTGFETDIIYDIVVLPEGGGFLCVGLTYSKEMEGYHGTGALMAGHGDGWMLKLDTGGNIVWQKAFGGYDFDMLSTVTLTASGLIIAAGETCSSLNSEGGSIGHFDNWVLSVGTDGNILWQHQFGSKGIERIYDMVDYIDSSVILLGGTNFINNKITADYNITIIKMNTAKGDIEWENQWGGDAWDIGNSIAVDDNRRIIVAGQSESETNGFKNKGMTDAFVAAFDSSGNNIWCQNFGGSFNDYFNSIIVTKDKYIAIGTSISSDKDLQEKPIKVYWPNKNADVIAVVFNSVDGTVDKKYILCGSDLDLGKGIAKSTSDGFFIFGYTMSDDGHFEKNKSKQSFLWYALLKI